MNVKRKTSLKHLEMEAEELSKNIAFVKNLLSTTHPNRAEKKRLENQLRAQTKRYEGVLEKANNYGKEKYWKVRVATGTGIKTLIYPGYVEVHELQGLVSRDLGYKVNNLSADPITTPNL